MAILPRSRIASCGTLSKSEPLAGYFLDANLMVLLVVGSESRDLISKHRRLEHFSSEDYDILHELLEAADELFVTPNTLTEASNLVGQHREPERSLLMRRLQYLIHGSKELIVASADASSNEKFEQLGLTDTALLEAITTDTPLLTVDFDLYLAAIETGEEKAINFTPYRNL